MLVIGYLHLRSSWVHSCVLLMGLSIKEKIHDTTMLQGLDSQRLGKHVVWVISGSRVLKLFHIANEIKRFPITTSLKSQIVVIPLG